MEEEEEEEVIPKIFERCESDPDAGLEFIIGDLLKKNGAKGGEKV